MELLNMIHKLYFLKIDENMDEDKFTHLLLLTSIEKQHKINQFRFAVDKKLSLFSNILVQYIACQSLNTTINELHFTNNEYGKPYLTGYPNFHYNISHIRNAIVVGVSNKPIGVDIEKIKQSDLKIANRFFADNEIKYILSDAKKYDKLFYEIWTKKEAYIKWIGKGLSVPLQSFDVLSDEINDKIGIFQIDDYSISVCCEEKFSLDCLIELSEKDLYGRALLLLENQLS
ncbi:MAG TPA: 4'-phosphopantetheinyl transferase superfamily protein [Candidatus Paceibacterota bacterium]